MSNLIKILAFLLFLSACKSTNSEVKYSEIPSDRSNAKPGAGWDLDKEQLIGNCVVGNVEK